MCSCCRIVEWRKGALQSHVARKRRRRGDGAFESETLGVLADMGYFCGAITRSIQSAFCVQHLTADTIYRLYTEGRICTRWMRAGRTIANCGTIVTRRPALADVRSVKIVTADPGPLKMFAQQCQSGAVYPGSADCRGRPQPFCEPSAPRRVGIWTGLHRLSCARQRCWLATNLFD